ncbi:MAG: hypothetical protein L0Z50_36470 [Verrucomicrobiales bacterium]|nr:hypothetical protein [Verrucomicrobiales bacterium]
MKLGSPAIAIGWEIWRRNRVMFSLVGAGFVLGGIVSHVIGPHHPWTHSMESTCYSVLCAMLLMTFGAFHFTEGRKKGGFGSFPIRLFRAPVPTRWLVGLPMLYGSLSILAVYWGAALFLFRPLGRNLPILWPCLYLVFGFTQFQMIVWSFPEHRYLKLLCLSLAATIILTGWMFFLPHVVEGTLSEWGYTGNPQLFLRMLLAGVALTLPGAYLVSLFRVDCQRHGLASDFKWCSDAWDLLDRKLFPRRTNFRSAAHAIFWQEWRQTGLILPLCVAVIAAMICLPTFLSGPVEVRGTRAVLLGLFLSPILLALIIGRGFGKPNFWEPSLSITPFHAVRPLASGDWVIAKLKVAFGSVILTWLIVLAVTVLWLIFGGDFQAFDGELETVRFYYSPPERVIMSALGLISFVLLAWRFLIGGLAAGLSGRKLWFYLQNTLTVIFLLSILSLLMARNDEPNQDSRLYKLWPYIAWMPVFLGSAVMAKSILAFVIWNKVERRKLFAAKSISLYLAGWIVATAVPAILVMIVFENTPWLRSCFLLLSLLWVPLCGPGLAALSLANNRSGS